MKKIAIACFMLLFIAIVGCGQKQEQPKYYTYQDLSENQQKIVDKVLKQYYVWKSAYVGPGWRDASNVTFFKEDGQLIFAVCYKDKVTPDIAQVYMFCEVDTETGKLSGHNYTVYDSTKEMVAMVRASSGQEF